MPKCHIFHHAKITCSGLFTPTKWQILGFMVKTDISNCSTMLEDPKTKLLFRTYVPKPLFLDLIFHLEGEYKKSTQAHNLAINKQSTTLVLSSWNLVKIFIEGVLDVVKILAWLDENCGFFINRQILVFWTSLCSPSMLQIWLLLT